MNAPYAPIAKHLASHGRGEDSVLIHMTPKEVGGLQSLAMAHGGSLTINPHTGLPEAGWLGKLLPMILGAAATVVSGGTLAPWMAALAVGGGQTAITGSLTKGLMAGLGAFGGASLAAGLGAGAASAVPEAVGGVVPEVVGGVVPEAVGGVASGAGAFGAGTAAMPTLASSVAPQLAAAVAPSAAAAPGLLAGPASSGFSLLGAGTPAAAPAILAPAASTVAPTVGTGFPSSFKEFGTRFSEAAGEGLGGAGKISTNLAAMGLLGGVAGAMQPSDKMPEEEEDKYPYKGPYLPMERRAIFRVPGDPSLLTDSSERNYFEPSNPYPGYIENPNYVAPVSPNVKTRFADGGAVPMAEKDYGFNAFRSQIPPSRPSGMFNDSIGFMGSGMDYTNVISAIMAQQGVNGGTAFPGLGAPPPPPTLSPINRPPSGGPAQGQEFDYGFKPLYGPQPTKAPNQPPPGSQQGDQPPLGVQGNQRNQRNQRNQAAQTTQMPYPPSPGAQTNTTYPPPYMMNPMLQQYMSQNQNTSFPQSFAAGGENLRDGAFVVDARTVSEMGNGSSGAGQELLARYGGKPIRGRGDGVSDSVRANIGGVQEARVARDEVKFEPEAVSRLGGGSQQKGAQKLYSLMAKAHKARRKAKPGQDTKLRGLLGA